MITSRTKQISICVILLLLNLNTSILPQDSSVTIHVFVALCDNENQGIIPVPSKLGNGEDPTNNLYWGARFGVKTYFANSKKWKLLSTIKRTKEAILERCIFKHQEKSVYLVADAYKGVEIKQALSDFLQAASGNYQESFPVKLNSQTAILEIGDGSSLVAYIGHNGLMDFDLETYPQRRDDKLRDAIILACASKPYFTTPLRKAGANPLLWTTGLMAPEAYTLESASEGWILNESAEQIRLRAANAYNKYQNCGVQAARNLFASGW